MTSEVYVAVERSDGSVAHVAVQLRMRVPGEVKPHSMEQLRARGWYQTDGLWARDDTDEVINGEVRRFEAEQWSRLDGITVVRWRRLSQEEHELFGQYRHHRDAMEMKSDGTIAHNMPKARELHQHLLRHQRAEKLLYLDGVANAAQASGSTALLAQVESIRAQLRDVTGDPRINAATRIEELADVRLDADGEVAFEELKATIAAVVAEARSGRTP